MENNSQNLNQIEDPLVLKEREKALNKKFLYRKKSSIKGLLNNYI